jgi:hypothetical protein
MTDKVAEKIKKIYDQFESREITAEQALAELEVVIAKMND